MSDSVDRSRTERYRVMRYAGPLWDERNTHDIGRESGAHEFR
ncbi:MAG: hypothetical protein AAF945_11385 [Actinomycetota bacterium]